MTKRFPASAAIAGVPWLPVVKVFTWNSPPTRPTSAVATEATSVAARTSRMLVVVMSISPWCRRGGSWTRRARGWDRVLRLTDEPHRPVVRGGGGRVAADLGRDVAAPANARVDAEPHADASLRGLVQRIPPRGRATLHGDAVARDTDDRDRRPRRPIPISIGRDRRRAAHAPVDRRQVDRDLVVGETARVVDVQARAVDRGIAGRPGGLRDDPDGERIETARRELQADLPARRRGAVAELQRARRHAHEGLAAARRARRILRVRVLVLLGQVREAVGVAVDADARARSRRHGRVGEHAAGRGRERAERRVAELGLGREVAAERPGLAPDPSTAPAVVYALHDDVALVLRGAREHQVDARVDVGAAPRGERRLLADDRGEVRVEGQHEALDLPAHRVARRAGREATRMRAAGGEATTEAETVREAKDR